MRYHRLRRHVFGTLIFALAFNLLLLASTKAFGFGPDHSINVWIKNTGQQDLYVARITQRWPMSFSSGWHLVPAGERVRVVRGESIPGPFMFGFAKLDEKGQLGAVHPKFPRAGGPFTATSKGIGNKFPVRAEGWDDRISVSPMNPLRDLEKPKPGYTQIEFALWHSPYVDNMKEWHRDDTFSVNVDDLPIRTPLPGAKVGLKPTDRTLSPEEVAEVFKEINSTVDILFGREPSREEAAKPEKTPRQLEYERRQARLAKHNEAMAFLVKRLQEDRGADPEIARFTAGLLLWDRDSNHRRIIELSKATDARGQVSNPEQFNIVGSKNALDIAVTILVTDDPSNRMLEHLLTQLYGYNSPQWSYHVEQLNKQLGAGRLVHDWRETVGYKYGARKDGAETLAMTNGHCHRLALSLRGYLIERSADAKAMWAFAQPDADMLFSTAMTQHEKTRAGYERDTWAHAISELDKWWKANVDPQGALPHPRRVHQQLMRFLSQDVGYKVVGKFDDLTGELLVQTEDGTIYGVARGNTRENKGGLFRVAPTGIEFVHTFEDRDGHETYAAWGKSHALWTRGNEVYGVRDMGGRRGHATIMFRYSPTAGFKHVFNGEEDAVLVTVEKDKMKWNPKLNGAFAISGDGRLITDLHHVGMASFAVDVEGKPDPDTVATPGPEHAFNRLLFVGRDGLLYCWGKETDPKTRQPIRSGIYRMDSKFEKPQFLVETDATDTMLAPPGLSDDKDAFLVVIGPYKKGPVPGGGIVLVSNGGKTVRVVCDKPGKPLGVVGGKLLVWQTSRNSSPILLAADIATGKSEPVAAELFQLDRNLRYAKGFFLAHGAVWGIADRREIERGKYIGSHVFKINLPADLLSLDEADDEQDYSGLKPPPED